MSEFLEPPKHDLASRDVHALDGTDPAAAAPAHAAAWGAAPDDESALLGPTLGDPGRGLELAHLAIDTLANAVGGLPEQAVTLAQAEVERLQTLRVAAMFNPQQAMAIDPQLVAANTTLASAQDAQKLRKQEFDIMRDKVFNTDAAQLTAEARLQAKGISSTKLDEFKKAAATASTPAQLSTIEALY